jgi:ATP-binding cassette subfamily B protein
VRYENVRFSYDGTRDVLSGVDLDLEPGTVTALVGTSGSGKSTIARLIARFWDVDGGSVRIGGADVRALTTETLMAQLAMVFQDTYLFDGTIADNLRVARPEVTDAELEHVSRLARLDEILERLPDGWDTHVGEAGTALSGGERQRVAIARALLKDAPILLLDEATAALDPTNEEAVQNAIDALRGKRTIIVMAHRLATVVAADQIVVLHEGRIVERGSHDELLALDGRYAAFWRERSRARGWRLGNASVASA